MCDLAVSSLLPTLSQLLGSCHLPKNREPRNRKDLSASFGLVDAVGFLEPGLQKAAGITHFRKPWDLFRYCQALHKATPHPPTTHLHVVRRCCPGTGGLMGPHQAW